MERGQIASPHDKPRSEQDPSQGGNAETAGYSIPLTRPTITLVQNLTFLSPPFHSCAYIRILLTSSASLSRRTIVGLRAVLPSFSFCSLAGGGPSVTKSCNFASRLAIVGGPSSSEGTTITNVSSVSIQADRAFKFVDPNSVRTGGASCAGDTHMPDGTLQPSC